MSDKPTLTTSAGAPIADNQAAITAGLHGPVLLQDYQLLEKLAHLNREQIPERTVHAKGSSAHGPFTVTTTSLSTPKRRSFRKSARRPSVSSAISPTQKYAEGVAQALRLPFRLAAE